VRARSFLKIFRPGVFIVGGLLLLATVIALWAIPSNEILLLPDRAHPAAPLVKVAGATTKHDRGAIYFVDVEERTASVLESLFGGLHSGADLVPTNDVVSPGISPAAQRKVDLQEMRQSQQTAAAVALRADGRKVLAVPNGALVEDVEPGMPAAGALRPTDVIVAIDGKPVRSVEAASSALAGKRAGDVVQVKIRRGRQTLTYPLKMVESDVGPRKPVIGVILSQSQRIVLPVRVAIDSGNIGGPSAGLAFALEVLQQLGRNVDHGHDVAATGTISLDGAVGPIGGIKQKTIGAREAGVDAFLVPAGDNAREARKYAHGLRIIPVETFQQALRALATLPTKS
jgi:PDZ domain-containing protein